MQKHPLIHRIVLGAVALWVVIIALTHLVREIKSPPGANAPESVYAKVMKTRTLRCGYILFPPAVIKDPNTGEFSGIAVDIMQKIGERLGLKIDWTEEVSFATNVQGLQTGRYDAVCITYWMNPNEGKFVGFSVPFYYSGMVGAQQCEKQKNQADWNDPAFKIAMVDGSVASRLAAARFPKAQSLTLPNSADVTQLLMNVATAKADMAFVEPFQIFDWNAKNTDKKLCADDKPVAVFPNVIALPQGDTAFKSMIDAALTDIINNGEMSDILNKHEKYPGSFYRLAKPYRE